MNQQTFPHLFLIFIVLFSITIVFSSCTTTTKTIAPLGPEAFISYGSTKGQNKFDPLNTAICIPREADHTENRFPAAPNLYAAGDPPLNVFCLLADTKDHRFTGTSASLQAYRDARFNNIQPNTNSFWIESSFSNVSINMTMPTRIIQMSGTFNDYFNRTFVEPTLTTVGLKTATYPLTFAPGEKATITVRDIYDKDTDVTINLPASVADFNQLRMLWTNAIASVGMNPNWLTTDVSLQELVFKLDRLLVGEGSFIRPKSGSALAKIGLSGPMEVPGNIGPASLTGKPVPGGFPVTLAAPGATMKFEVRDKDYKTRTYLVTVPAGTYANPVAITSLIVPKLNTEFSWVQAMPAGANQLGLSVVPAFSGPHAAIRLIFAVGEHSAIGLDGPIRVDGVVSAAATDTLRGDWSSITEEALSIYIRDRAKELGIPVDAAHEIDLDQIVKNELKGFDSYMVVFADDLTTMPSGKRGGASGGYFDIRVPGVGGFTYENQINASLVLGQGTTTWQTYAHEFGHNLGMWDLYHQPNYDTHFNIVNSYLRAWSLMDQDSFASHPEGWHKNLKQFISAGTLQDIFPPPPGQTEHHKFTVIPLEYSQAEYSDFGDFEFPIAQYIRIHLAMKHWIGVENREPGKLHSQKLPDDVSGRAPANPPGRPGGILVTDVVDPWEVLYRPPVSVMNPHGSGFSLLGNIQARGMKAGDFFPLTSTYPKYDGIHVNVIEEVPGPIGKPRAFKVDIVWGPGNFVELGLRPWQAPNVYGSPDIWLDWPGNGNENFPSSDPPVGTGDQVHWSPDGSVVNLIKIRLHNWGTILAKKVVVRAFINEPMGMGDRGTFVPFPDSAPQDISAGGFKDYAFEWRPKSSGHTCIGAVIFTHDSDLSDLDPKNNYAQENVDDFWPAPGSPYKPIEFQFKLTNDFEHDVEAELRPSQLPDGMDVELERRYVKMLPKQELLLRGRLYTDINKITPDFREQNQKYCFNLHAFKRTPDSVLPFGGITVNVHPGYPAKLEFDKIFPERRGTAVIIIGKLKGPFPGNETVDAAITGSDGNSYGGTAKTDPSGNFHIAVDKVSGGSGRLMLYYFGPKMTAAFEGPIKVNLPQLNP